MDYWLWKIKFHSHIINFVFSIILNQIFNMLFSVVDEHRCSFCRCVCFFCECTTPNWYLLIISLPYATTILWCSCWDFCTWSVKSYYTSHLSICSLFYGGSHVTSHVLNIKTVSTFTRNILQLQLLQCFNSDWFMPLCTLLFRHPTHTHTHFDESLTKPFIGKVGWFDPFKSEIDDQWIKSLQ